MGRAPLKRISDSLAKTLDGAMLVDEDGKVVVWNKAAERLLGFRAREVVGRPCHEVLCGQTLDGEALCSVCCPIGCKLAHGGGVHNFDMQTHTKTGRLVWLNISSLPVPSQKKGRFQAMHLFRDITKQVRVHNLVRELSSVLSSTEGFIRPEPKPAQPSAARSHVLPPIQRALALSGREREILDLLACGQTTNGIADALYISPATVRNHIQHILEKLGAHSRLQALAIAYHPGTPSS